MHKPDHKNDFLKSFFGNNKVTKARDGQNAAYQNLLRKKKPRPKKK